jgi:hypothetical protein
MNFYFILAFLLLLLKQGGQRLRKKLSLQNLGPKLSLKTIDVTPIKEILNNSFRNTFYFKPK